VADIKAAQRKVFAKMGIAMPDGSYYVRNASDLKNAIDSVGRGEDAGDNGNAIRKHIMSRAQKLGLTKMIPSTWAADGSLKHFATVEEALAHFGIKGMKWGVRKSRGGDGASHPSSSDADRAAELKQRVKSHGTKSLSNEELQHLVTRLNLVKQHGQLNPKQVSFGEHFVHETLKIGSSVAKQQATVYAGKYAAAGIERLVEKATS
jgi:hypothetical protein